MPNLLIVSDAWAPQINGVVRTLEATVAVLQRRGWTVHLITPEQFRTVPCPGYRSVRLAVPPYRMKDRIKALGTLDAIHVSTEGPLGWAARNALLKLGLPFTTAYHTNFPAYLRRISRFPEGPTYAALRRFHKPSSCVMTPTAGVNRLLASKGFPRVAVWGRGVDDGLFHPRVERHGPVTPRPVFINVGRVSAEKGLPDFLALDLPGTKVVVGDGPVMEDLMQRFPDVRFWGARAGEALARAYAYADVFVFPSRTDTFGLVMAEAIAMGIPVAAYPVTGPLDVVTHGVTGWLSEDLREACIKCLDLDRAKVADGGKAFSWEAATDQFVANLAMIP